MLVTSACVIAAGLVLYITIGLAHDQKQLVGAHAQRNSPVPARLRGRWRWLYENSLALVMTTIFLAAWFGQSVTAWTEYSVEQEQHGEAPVSWLGYLQQADFWGTTLRNWQSEFLAVGTMAVFTIYLRQRGSPSRIPSGRRTIRREPRADRGRDVSVS